MQARVDSTRRPASMHAGAVALALFCLWLLQAPAVGGASEARRYRGPDGTPLPFRGEADALAFLRSARIVDREPIGHRDGRRYRVVLEDGSVRARAVLRLDNRRVRTDRGQVHDRAVSECAAYRVARRLRLDSVPPTVCRTVDGRRVSLQLWIEDATTVADRLRARDLPPRWGHRRRPVWTFDNLLHNTDRHPGNLLLDADGRLWLVDHTRAFQEDTGFLGTGAVPRLQESLREPLRTTSEATWTAILEPYLEPAQVEAFLTRRRAMLDGGDGRRR